MSIEIERKFLVNEKLVPKAEREIAMVQAYLHADPDRTIRVRIAGNSAYLTIKGRMVGFSRPEFEYEIPMKDAREMLQMAATQPVEKVRHEIYVDGKKWEVDFFEGANKGLVLAEIELSDESEQIQLPDWIREEVTGQIQYYNSYLAKYPFMGWE
jgi:adenylate cyclase